MSRRELYAWIAPRQAAAQTRESAATTSHVSALTTSFCHASRHRAKGRGQKALAISTGSPRPLSSRLRRNQRPSTAHRPCRCLDDPPAANLQAWRGVCSIQSCAHCLSAAAPGTRFSDILPYGIHQPTRRADQRLSFSLVSVSVSVSAFASALCTAHCAWSALSSFPGQVCATNRPAQHVLRRLRRVCVVRRWQRVS